MRVQIRQQGDLWRVTEANGELTSRWLPLGPLIGALDRGGFTDLQDAKGFALGIDLVRAEAGCLGELTARDIDAERAELDADQRGRWREPLPDLPMFEAA